MKKTFRFMVMAIAAIVMAGTTVACDPMDKADEKQEQTGDNAENEGTENEGTENEGTENEGEAPAAITLDGKQWVAVVEEGVSGYCFDFGVTTPGMYIECSISLNPTAPAYYKFTDTTPGEYLIEAETETTGKLTVVNPMWGPAVYQYKNLTATSVEIEDPIYCIPGNFITFTVAEQLIVDQVVSE